MANQVKTVQNESLDLGSINYQEEQGSVSYETVLGCSALEVGMTLTNACICHPCRIYGLAGFRLWDKLNNEFRKIHFRQL